MQLKTFTFYALGKQLDSLSPGLGLTVDYEILERLLASIHSSGPPDHLRDEFYTLAADHGCELEDHNEERYLHFRKVGNRTH